MTLHIIVPVKRLAEAKGRLAPVLAQAERRELMLLLLRAVLSAVSRAQEQLAARGVVISPDQDVLQLAARFGLVPLREQAPPAGAVVGLPPGDDEASLNAALEQATAWAVDAGASAVLVLPADLPFLTVADIEQLWQASQQLYSARAMVIAPDGREQGTNALLVRPPGALAYQFGVDSFHRHCQQARRLGMAWHIHRSSRLGLDVDVPEDLASYLAVENADMEPLRYDNPARQALFDAEAEAFLQQPGLLMRLGTVGRDGYPQVTPVWYLFQDGVFYITTASNRVKARNMLANPKVGLAIDSEVKPYRGLSVWGQARPIAEGEAARPLTRRIAARYVPDGRTDIMVETLMQAPRVVFAIEPVRVARMGSW